jgi:hypothetical protein
LELAVIEEPVAVRVDAETDLDAAGCAANVTRKDRYLFDEHVFRNAVAYISDARDLFFLELVVSVFVDTAQNRLPAVLAVLSGRLVERHRERVLAGRSVTAVLSIVAAGDEAETRNQSECRAHFRGLHERLLNLRCVFPPTRPPPSRIGSVRQGLTERRDQGGRILPFGPASSPLPCETR